MWERKRPSPEERNVEDGVRKFTRTGDAEMPMNHEQGRVRLDENKQWEIALPIADAPRKSTKNSWWWYVVSRREGGRVAQEPNEPQAGIDGVHEKQKSRWVGGVLRTKEHQKGWGGVESYTRNQNELQTGTEGELKLN
jgi:hypothetical protein